MRGAYRGADELWHAALVGRVQVERPAVAVQRRERRGEVMQIREHARLGRAVHSKRLGCLGELVGGVLDARALAVLGLLAHCLGLLHGECAQVGHGKDVKVGVALFGVLVIDGAQHAAAELKTQQVARVLVAAVRRHG